MNSLSTHARSVVLLALLNASSAWAGTWLVFGPETSTRAPGAPVAVTRSFPVTNPNATYVLRVTNAAPSAGFPVATITLNGVRVVVTLNLGRPMFETAVPLRPLNVLSIELAGKPGTGVRVEITGVDLDRPTISATISPSPNAAGWNHANATVTFACADATSGIAHCPPPVLVSSEGAGNVVSGTAIDNAGNTQTAAVVVKLDKTPPTIVGTLAPPPDAYGFSPPPAVVSFVCADQLSGMALCPPPVTVTAAGLHHVTGSAVDVAGNSASTDIPVKVGTNAFTLRNYGGRCLTLGTHGAGSPVFLHDCDGSPAQAVRVVEVTADHVVRLVAGDGDLVIGLHRESGGVLQDGATPGGPANPTYALELQLPAPLEALSVNQFFVLDGDSVLFNADRRLVFQVDGGLNLNGTAIVAGPRLTADSELWDFVATDGSDRDPTSGFVRIGYPGDAIPAGDRLRALLHEYGADLPPGQDSQAGPNTVIRIAPDAVIDLSFTKPLQVPAAVTIRGDRRGTRFGPLVCKTLDCNPANPPNETGSIFEVVDDNVRITGLRLQGTSRALGTEQPKSVGVLAYDRTAGPLAGHFLNTVIDHNDLSNFTSAGVMVVGSDAEGDGAIALNSSCDPWSDPFGRRRNVLVARNFIHHNRMQDAGYGVEANWGAFPLIDGNVFVSNRHAIAAGNGSAHTGYRAHFNLVLQDSALQRFGPITFRTHDFDMHGMNDHLGDGFGGLGGDYVDIFANTFLASAKQNTTRRNYELRGIPCHHTDFRGNVSLQTRDQAVVFKDSGIQLTDRIEYEDIADVPNQFNLANPTSHLKVGDFDGDGVDDTFLATGAAWYYAPQGNAEWRLLSVKTDRSDALLLGDFDGDGRTDVVGVNDGRLVVSWSGVSPWRVLNVLPSGASIGEMAAADFVDDRRADLFYTDGTSWYLASGGTQPFVEVNTSSFRVHDVRFGDFDGDGKTDVFGVTSGTWSYSRSAGAPWTDGYLRQALAPVDALVVADFNGDGRADVATPSAIDLQTAAFTTPPVFDVNGYTWKIAYGGVENWTTHRITPTAGCRLDGFYQAVLEDAGLVAAVGRFNDGAAADLLLWGSGNASNFCIVEGMVGALARQSRQDMR